MMRDLRAQAAIILSVLMLAANSDDKTTIAHNPDGTFSIQKQSHTWKSKRAKPKAGLVIPPQVVVPITSGIENKP